MVVNTDLFGLITPRHSFISPADTVDSLYSIVLPLCGRHIGFCSGAVLRPEAVLQLCKGATPEERKHWGLAASVQDYTYLSASGCCEIMGVNDGADFLDVKHSLSVVGIDKESQVGGPARGISSALRP